MPRVVALSLVGLSLCACAPKPAPAAPSEPAPPVVAAPEPAPEPAKPEPPPPVCRVDPLPAAPAPPPADGKCAPIPPALQRRLGGELVRAYKPTAPGAKAVATFACDPLIAPAELVHETGVGHGHSLRLTRLRWQGGKIAALRLYDAGGLVVERAELETKVIEARLPDLVALALATLSEQVPKDVTGMSAYGSSHDWHASVRLVDAGGRALERSFTDYDSSSTQLAAIPVAALDKRLDAALAKVQWQPAALDDDARAFFVERYVAAGPGRAKWWIKEQLVRLAALAGTPALVPSLVALALEAGDDASVRRTRTAALAALAALAGFDARTGPDGAAVPEVEAAALYARACTK